MKLFIWADPYSVSYGTSMAMAVAESLEQAVEMLKTSGKSYTYAQYEEKEHPTRIDLSGIPPTRVIDCPCAEWHEWSE